LFAWSAHGVEVAFPNPRKSSIAYFLLMGTYQAPQRFLNDRLFSALSGHGHCLLDERVIQIDVRPHAIMPWRVSDHRHYAHAVLAGP